ncbi:MAG: 2Fe-2S iron-sulfur cluster-binding protein, partial [Variovorax sp.]|nr:2Fe-2S iron-sulfur cluster-binding protein [Variovorax sp.]
MSARLTHSSIATGGRPIRFWYDGQAVDGLEGETVAAALAASHIRQMRHTRDGERRGLYCGMGACFDCLVTIDGMASQRACLTKVADGQQIRSAMPAGTPADPLQSLTPPADAEPAAQDVDVLVVGAGPAGLSAALAARQAGASVLVLDERLQSGGQFYKPLAPSHHAPGPADRQFADGLA